MRKAIAVFAICGQAHAQDIGSAQQGLALARAQCSECHRVEGSGPSPSPGAPGFVHIANTPGMTSAALVATLRTSHRTMPNIIIKDNDVGDLVAYMQSLKRKE
jgi:mono/diheme cytochrome c family protein